MAVDRFLDTEGLRHLWEKIKSFVFGKADKVQNATNGNFAGLDSTGNLTDSGYKHSDFLTQHQHLPEYTIEKLDQAETSYSASYVLKKDGTQVGATINIPKDMVVSSGEVKTVTVANEPYQGAQVGDKYIDLTIANTSQNHIYIPVKDLVDVYIAGNGIQISDNNYISVKVNQNQSNGLGVGYDGISMYVVTPSINGVGGTNGSMLATDKEKLDGIEAGAEANVIETVKVSGTALQVTDKAVNIETETAYDPTTNKIATMSDVTGATPNVGHLKTDNTSALTPSASESFTGDISLHKVAKTGAYSDLNGKPTIPSAGDFVTSLGTSGNNVTWTKNGTTNNLTVPYATNAGTSSHIGSSTVGSGILPVYINSGTPNAITRIPGSLVKGSGINSMINSTSGVGINPSINGAGMNLAKGGSVVLVMDDFKFKMSETNPKYLDILFDGLNSTYFLAFEPSSAIDVSYHSYSTSNTYSIGDIVIYKNAENKVRWYRSKTNNNTGNTPTHEEDNTYWEYVSGTGSYASGMNPQKFSSVSLLVTLASSASYEAGLSLYWRTNGQHPKYLTVQKYSDSTFETLAGTCCTQQDMTNETVTSVYCGNAAVSQGKYFKLKFEGFYETNYWAFACTQIAFTGNIGGIEGTVVMRKGGNTSTMFGDFYPNDDVSINLGASSKRWNNVYANKFIKKDGTSSQFLKADGSVDSNTYATTSQLPSLPLSIANGGTGATTAKAAEYNLTPNLGTEITSEFSDTGMIPCLVSPSNTTNGRFYGYRTMAKVWNYIKSKISSVLGIGGSDGVPTAPTAAAGTNTTQIATTAFVTSATSGMAIDTNVVHKTGNETIAGVKTFTNNVKTQDADVIFETKNGDKHTVGISLDSQPFEQAEYTAGALRFSDISLNGIPVLLKNILNPIETQDAATKGYVDSEIENIQGERVMVQGWTGQYGMSPYSLVAFAKTSEGMVLTSFTTTGGTGQKTPVTSYKFPIGSKIYFYDSETSGATAGALWEVYTQFRPVDARYSAITGENVSLGSSTSSSAYYYTTSVFLRVSMDGEYWKPYYKDGSTEEIIVSLDQLVSGNYYIYLGRTTAEWDDVNHRYFQLEDNNPLYYYDGTDLVDWATHISEIGSSSVLPSGGTTGQVLAKASNADNDVEWINQSAGVTDYDDLDDKPQINGVTLSGNKTSSQLGLQSELTFDNVPTANSDNPVKSGGVKTALDAKQDTLVSGTNIKTVNNTSLLGSGNIQINDGVGFQTITTQQDGTMQITLTNGDTITVDLNHVHPQYYSKVMESVMPQGGFLPDVVYSLGVLSSNITFALAPAVVGNTNHYYWTFSTATTAITVTWPTKLIWANGSAPTIAANKHYEISILDSIAVYMETSIQEND